MKNDCVFFSKVTFGKCSSDVKTNRIGTRDVRPKIDEENEIYNRNKPTD